MKKGLNVVKTVLKSYTKTILKPVFTLLNNVCTYCCALQMMTVLNSDYDKSIFHPFTASKTILPFYFLSNKFYKHYR